MERIVKKFKQLSIHGYDPMEVVKYLQGIHERENTELTILQQKIATEKMKNQTLLAELDKKKANIQKPIVNPLIEELNTLLKVLFIQQTKELVDFQNKLANEKTEIFQELEVEKRNHEQTRKRLQESMEYFIAVSQQPIDILKEREVK